MIELSHFAKDLKAINLCHLVSLLTFEFLITFWSIMDE